MRRNYETPPIIYESFVIDLNIIFDPRCVNNNRFPVSEKLWLRIITSE